MANTGQIPWPSPGRSHGHHRADPTTATGQFLLALDTGAHRAARPHRSRSDALLDQALNNRESWAAALVAPPKDEWAAATWRRFARTVAAYRDRYGITGPAPLGAPAENEAQRIDAARARRSLTQARGQVARDEPGSDAARSQVLQL